MENVLKFTIGQSDNNEMVKDLTNIINNTVAKNAELISFTVDKQINGESVQYILDAYIDHLLSLMLRDFDKDRLLQLVSSGALFNLRRLLEEKLMSNTMIQEAIENKADLLVV